MRKRKASPILTSTTKSTTLAEIVTTRDDVAWDVDEAEDFEERRGIGGKSRTKRTRR